MAKYMSTDTVYLEYETLQPGTPVDIVHFPLYSRVYFMRGFCGLIKNTAIPEHFIELKGSKYNDAL